jgi:hypothetical protein
LQNWQTFFLGLRTGGLGTGVLQVGQGGKKS